MKPSSILTALLLSSVLSQAQTTFIGGNLDPGSPLTNNLMNAANWDNGLPDGDGTNPGTVGLDATWADPATGGSISLTDFDFTITGGATVSRGASFIDHLLGDTDIVIENGTMDNNAGPGSRALRVRDTSSITVEVDGILIVSGNNLEFGTTGAVIINGGSVTVGGKLKVATSASYAFLTFGAGNGSVTAGQLIDFRGNTQPYVDFLTGSGGTLDLVGADQVYYEDLWTAGQLRVDGANTGVFADHFAVVGSALSMAGGADPKMQVESTFSFTTNGAASFEAIAVTNLGATNDLTITGVIASGTAAGTVSNIDFPIDPIPAGGGINDIFFDFTPTGPGVYEFNLEIASNDQLEPSPRVVAVTIEVREPLIGIDTNTISYILPNTPGPQTSIITVTNTSDGTLDLNVTGTTITGDAGFTVTSVPAGPIAPFATGEIEVTFDPGVTDGFFNATLEIQSDDYLGNTPQVTLFAQVEPAAALFGRIDFGPSDSPVYPNYTQFISGDGATQIIAGATVTLVSKNGDMIGGDRGLDNPDDLRRDTAQTGGEGNNATNGDYLSVFLSGFATGTLNFVSSHDLATTGYTIPQDISFGEVGGTLDPVATGVTRGSWVEHTAAVEAGKTYELRMADASSNNRCYISSLLMWGDALTGVSVYGTWASGYGLDPEWTTGDPALDGRPGSDPDEDGKTNNFEFATDDNPTSAASSGKVVGKVADIGGDNALTLTLPVRGTPLFSPDGPTGSGMGSDPVDGLIYRIQGAADLLFEGDNESLVDEVVPALDSGLPALNSGWSYRSFRTDGTTATDATDFIRALINP